jgi:hypothetical protein
MMGVMSLLRLPPGPVDLDTIATDTTPGFEGGKSDGKQALTDLGGDLAELQERLFAEGRSGSHRRVLLVLQGMDTSGASVASSLASTTTPGGTVR